MGEQGWDDEMQRTGTRCSGRPTPPPATGMQGCGRMRTPLRSKTRGRSVDRISGSGTSMRMHWQCGREHGEGFIPLALVGGTGRRLLRISPAVRRCCQSRSGTVRTFAGWRWGTHRDAGSTGPGIL
jgi:hypothetical protein